MSKHHYVYHSYEEWGREYIGIRSCDCLPEEDIQYFGSFRDKSFNPTKKTILFVRETREEVAEIEIILHDFFDVAINPKFANKAKATSTKFDTTGVTWGPHTEEWKKAKSESTSGKNNPCYGRTGETHPLFGKVGSLHHNSKGIKAIQPDGTELHFGSTREATRELGVHNGHLCSKYLKTGKVLTKGKFKGWRFVFGNP
jgi:hypothetical protein